MEKKKLAVAIPASVISDTPHLREKTAKIGLIGRAAAIFRVDEVIVYNDKTKANQHQNSDLIATLLAYMETPQYLRKQLFRIEQRLRYAGILPPLRTPHHTLNRNTKKLKVGEYREGLIISRVKEGVLVEIGVERPALLRETGWALRKRLTLQIINVGERAEVQTANRDTIPYYWGYTVKVENSFLKLLENGKFDLTIATSKLGEDFSKVTERVVEKWGNATFKLIAFGAPARGLHEIVEDEGENLNDVVDFVVNTLPKQGTETVRTEEALLASLAILNVQFSR